MKERKVNGVKDEEVNGQGGRGMPRPHTGQRQSRNKHKAIRHSRTIDNMLIDVAGKINRVLRLTSMSSVDELLASDDAAGLLRRQGIPLNLQ